MFASTVVALYSIPGKWEEGIMYCTQIPEFKCDLVRKSRTEWLTPEWRPGKEFADLLGKS
jgi:hypothetical protein